MAPKKRAPANASRSRTPDVVTTKAGKEYQATAALSRPTRNATQTDLSFPDTAPVRAPNKPIVPSTVKKSITALKRGPGRPPKDTTAAAPTEAAANPSKRGPPKSTGATTSSVFPVKRGRGRPKSATANTTVEAAPAAKSSGTKKKRGRPAKETVSEEPPKKRGRPPRAKALADAVAPEDQQRTPKKRGALPYGGETTKIDSDDDLAAEQLEEELQDEVAEPISAPKKRGRPPKGKGKAKQTSIQEDAPRSSKEPAVHGRQYWLMKAEQDGHDVQLANGTTINTKFTIDDLKSKDVPEPWDGVRNPTAAKNMRAMKQGDLAFFYASGGKMPGIVGIMEIVQEATPDVTTHDENSAGYVEDADKRDRWCVVHVEFRKKLSTPITRAELLVAKDAGPLAKMQEFTAARLSVSKVSEDEWNYIHSLIEDDEGEVDEKGEEEPDLNGGAVAEEAAPSSLLNGTDEDVAESTAVIEQEVNPEVLPSAAFEARIEGTTEDLDLPMPTSDTLFLPTDKVEASAPLGMASSSRPTSRGSRAGSTHRNLVPEAASRTGSRAGSRVGSVPRTLASASSRARSKTPQPRAGSVQPSSGGLMEAIGEE